MKRSLPWLPGAGLAVLLTITYWDAIRWMVFRWPLEPYSGGGFLIPLVSLYLVWSERERLAALPRGGSDWGLVVLAFGAALFLVGSWTGIHYPYALSLIVVLWGLVLWLWGRAVALELLFPIAFLVFMIPLSWALDTLTFPLRLVATRAAAWLPMALGLPTEVSGTEIHVSGFKLLIDLPCSGLRFALALMAGGALVAYLSECNLWRKVVVFLSAIPLAVLANIVRIDLALLLGQAFGDRAARGVSHDATGLVVFAIALIALLCVARSLCPRPTDAG